MGFLSASLDNAERGEQRDNTDSCCDHSGIERPALNPVVLRLLLTKPCEGQICPLRDAVTTIVQLTAHALATQLLKLSAELPPVAPRQLRIL